ncbi:MAG: trypsin-like peptidase domain-containing protein [Armatimonadetes bacterium]|nr:trypsin-like peptidase domain-containing protein [Armatimonadota bacterium]
MNSRFTPALIILLTALPALSLAQEQINDRQIRRTLESALQDEIAAGDLLSGAVLVQQLSRATAKIKLPESFDLCGPGDDLYAAVKRATLVVASYKECDQCGKHHHTSASGFMISANGLAVTSYHVLDHEDASAFAVMTSDGIMHPILEVVAASKRHDVAVIRVKGGGYNYLPIATTARPGSDVFVLSHPNGAYYYMTRGVVARYSNSGRRPILEITADSAAGSSGGPVVNERGQVVGIVKATTSVYYHTPKEGQTRGDLQMVRKLCVPSSEILALFSSDRASTAASD